MKRSYYSLIYATHTILFQKSHMQKQFCAHNMSRILSSKGKLSLKESKLTPYIQMQLQMTQGCEEGTLISASAGTKKGSISIFIPFLLKLMSACILMVSAIIQQNPFFFFSNQLYRQFNFAADGSFPVHT